MRCGIKFCKRFEISPEDFGGVSLKMRYYKEIHPTKRACYWKI
jgi:hypothetical protein